jgi:hypothetical protein
MGRGIVMVVSLLGLVGCVGIEIYGARPAVHDRAVVSSTDIDKRSALQLVAGRGQPMPYSFGGPGIDGRIR